MMKLKTISVMSPSGFVCERDSGERCPVKETLAGMTKLAFKFCRQVWTKCGSGEHCSPEMTREIEGIVTLCDMKKTFSEEENALPNPVCREGHALIC